MEEVIKGVHRQGHLGEHKTWKAFNRKFITAEGRKKCREIVRTCPECQLGKDYKQRHLPKGTIESLSPWDVVSIDIMGPFPYDDNAKRFIVTMMVSIPDTLWLYQYRIIPHRLLVNVCMNM